jgi:uncharacterized membrane protein YdjX (TVP38/TMEM64 family)
LTAVSPASSRQELQLGGVKLRLLAKGLALMASLVAVGWGVRTLGLGHLDQHWIDAEIRGQGINGSLLFLAIGSLVVAVGLPRQLVCALAGYAFGLGSGLGLALAASMLGCLLCFYYARLLGRELVLHKFAGRVARLDDFLGVHPLTMAVLLRFLPVGSNLLTNLLAGVSGVRPLAFFAGTLIGYLPQTIVFVLLGSGIAVDPLARISLSVVLFVASAFLGVLLYRRMRQGRGLEDGVAEELS